LAATVLGAASMSLAQAPSSAQRWEVRYQVDGAGDNATAVGITIQARVAILPNSSASGTANFGVSRVGGAANAFFVRAADPDASLLGIHRMALGATGEVDSMGNPLLDVNGEALAGHFSQFRGGFPPPGPGNDNHVAFNGQFSVDVQGRAALTNVVGSRNEDYDGTPLGVASVGGGGGLEGAFANVYRFVYIPAPGSPRDVTFTSTGMTARYLFADFGNGAAGSAAAVAIGDISFSVRVPGPGAAGLLSVAALWGMRRRRA
jgi:MYXO-CTERM domain-containing protein